MAETPVFGRSLETTPEGRIEPIPFKIAGRSVELDEDGKEVWEEFEFQARGSVPMGSLMVLSSAAAGDGQEQTIAFLDFIYRSLVAGDRSRWRLTLDREDVEFDAEMFAVLVDWLSERWTGRPLRSRSARRAGPRRGGSMSRDGSHSRALPAASVNSR